MDSKSKVFLFKSVQGSWIWIPGQQYMHQQSKKIKNLNQQSACLNRFKQESLTFLGDIVHFLDHLALCFLFNRIFFHIERMNCLSLYYDSWCFSIYVGVSATCDCYHNHLNNSMLIKYKSCGIRSPWGCLPSKNGYFWRCSYFFIY